MGMRGAISVKEKCYIYFNQELSWYDAQDYCKTHLYRGTLAEFHTKEEITAVKSFPKKSFLGFWLGANDLAKKGTFIWMYSGLQIETNHSLWGLHQPDNGGNKEDCVNLFSTNTMNDYVCSKTLPFLCQTAPYV
ncbi:C-type lectin lectoxin-Thr1-like [Physella acuta]|uniref:C-type lectin lectoxin-Thr1-like n=1 Tax=Physella acuta TaxID=109671 RepID=UPI0027DC78DC|nr:C-type lectin lectoxin-Thr1-like [Physella acuta]